MDAIDREIDKIMMHRFRSAFEKRMESLTEEIEASKNELGLQGLGHSDALVKKCKDIRSNAVRDITFTVLNSAKEEHLKRSLPWTEEALQRTLGALETIIADQFLNQESFVRNEVVLAFGPQHSLVDWAVKEMDRAKTELKAEIMGEIDVLRSETHIQSMTAGHSSQRPRTVQINISGGQIGVLNVRGMITTIAQNLSKVNEAGNKDVVEAIRSLTEAVLASKDLGENHTKEALEQMEFLSNQCVSLTENRSKNAVISAVVASLRQLVSTAADLSQIWSLWGPKLESALRSMGLTS
jgi:hypothetical protein